MNYEEWKLENWSRAHRECDVSALTGTGLEGHLTALGVRNIATSDSTVLCIGVGTGVWVREAKEQFRSVWALDVVEDARLTIPWIDGFVTDPRKLPTNMFDLVMSLWVAPHMTNHDLEVQLREVVRSLKPGGILALHYKEPLNDDATIDNREGAEDEWRLASAAGIVRRRRYLAEVVSWAGGQVLRYATENKSQFYRINEVGVHIGKGATQ